MGKDWRYWAWGLPAVVMGLGCSEELGPERMETTRVSGVVREGPRTVGGGWIEFIPVDGTVGSLRSAPIRPDGTFEAEGVPVGRNAVGLVNAPIRSPGLRRTFDTLVTSIRRTIPSGASTEIAIDLIDEAGRLVPDRASGGAH